MKEKQPMGVLRCVQASAGDVEITEIQKNPSLVDTKKRSKINESGNKGASRVVIETPPTTSGKASSDDKSSSESTETTIESGGDGNPRRRIKNLAGFWAAPPAEDVKSFRKKRFQVDEGPDAGAVEGEEPERIVRAAADDGRGAENKTQIEISEGHAKGIANMFLNRSTDSATPKTLRRDKGFSSFEDSSAISNEMNQENTSLNPMSSTKLRRRIKDIAGTFSSTSTDDDVQLPRRKNSTVPSDAAEINSGTTDEPVVLEKGRTRGLADRWQQQRIEQENEATAARSAADDGRTKPAWLIELELAKELEPVVYENEPVVRDDVIRADDETTDVISARVAREARQMWTTIEKDEIKKKDDPQPKPKSVVAPLSDANKTCVEEKDIKDGKEADAGKEDLEKQIDIKSNEVEKEHKVEHKVKKPKQNKKEKEVVSDETVERLQEVQSKAETNHESATVTDLSQTRTIVSHNDDSDSDSDSTSSDDDGDNEDDEYISNDESGLILSGAMLMHIPRRKLVHSLQD